MNTTTIETVLLRHPSIADCKVVHRPTISGEPTLVAYVVAKGPFSGQQLRQQISLHQTTAHIPIIIVPLSTVPLTTGGEWNIAQLENLPVLDENLINHIETEMAALPGIHNAAAIIQADHETAAPLHLSSVLPDWHQKFSSKRSAGALTSVNKSMHAPSSSLSQANGEPLVTPPGAPAILSETLRRTTQLPAPAGITYYLDDGKELFLSYSELLSSAERILAGLRAQGLKPGGHVIFQLVQNSDFLDAFWACILGGFIPVPLAIAANYSDLTGAVRKLGAVCTLLPQAIILTQRPLAAALEKAVGNLGLTPRVVELEPLRHENPDHDWHPSQPDDIALMMLTSGSTGMPKGVPLSHRNLINRTLGSLQMHRFDATLVSLNWMPLDHVAGLIYFHLRDVHLGCQQIQVATEMILRAPLLWLDLIERYKVQITFAPNFAISLICGLDAQIARRHWNLSSMRFVLNGAEAIVAATARRFLMLLAPHGLSQACMQPAWGMSEISSGVTYERNFRLDNTADDDRYVSVGEPIPGVSLRIVDEHGQVLPEGEIGHLQITGATVFRGYYGDPQLNAGAFTADGWFKTGDMGQLKSGKLTITGREKDIIIINGVNYPGPAIEATVEGIPGITRSYTAACGIADPNANDAEALAIFFSPENSDEESLRSLLPEIRERVVQEFNISPAMLIPVQKADIPKTSIGKIQRSQLVRRLENGEFESNLRQVDLISANANTTPAWFFRREWRRKTRLINSETIAGKTLLLFADEPLAKECAPLITARQAHLIQISRGIRYTRISHDHFCINPDNGDEIRQVLQTLKDEGRTPTLGLYLWHGHADLTPATHADDYAIALESCAQFSAAVAGLSSLSTDFRLAVISRKVQQVQHDEGIDCARAPLLALVRTAAQEHPSLHSIHIDSDGALPLVLTQTFDELETAVVDREIAYRHNQRWVPVLTPAQLAPASEATPVLRHGGLYLISGGLGGVGSEVATYLLRELSARVILIGRSALPATQSDNPSLDDEATAKAAVWQRLTALGDVIYLQADVSDRNSLHTTLKPLLEVGQRLDGIFHLAGSFHELPVASENRTTLATLFGPKIGGAALLAELAQQNQATFIGFSSVTSFFGGALVGAYAAANLYLDALAQAPSTNQRYSLNWSSWKQTGLTLRHGANEPAQAMGMMALSPKQAITSLQIAMAQPSGQLIIGLDGGNAAVARLTASLQPSAHINLFYNADPAITPAALAAQLHISDAYGSTVPLRFTALATFPITETGEIDRAELARLARRDQRQIIAAATPAEQKLLAIWRRLLALDEISTDWSFFALGGQSLLATQLIAAIAEQFNHSWTLRDLFDAPTIVAQAARLEESGNSTVAAETALPAVVAISREQPLALSSAQQRLWFLDRIQPGNAAFHVPVTIRFHHTPDVAAVQRCLDTLITRHETLRTTFPLIGSEPQQKISGHLSITITTGRASADLNQEEYIAAEARKPFDLAAGPLMRAHLLTLADGSAALLITLHHIICDGWSMKVFFQEFQTLYLNDGDTAKLRPLPLQYADFAAWQRQLMEGQIHAEQLAYWREQLGSNLHGFTLPTDQPRPQVQSYSGALLKQTISASLVQRTRELARNHDATLFVTLLAAYKAMLARYAQQHDVIVGTVVANRDRPEFEGMIGFMINPVALRTDLSSDPRFVELLRRVHRVTVDAYAHHDIPFERLVDELQPPRDTSRSPLFQIAFDLRDPQITRSESSDITLSVMEPDLGAAQFDLRLTLEERGETLLAIWEFNTDLFAHATIERMAENYKTLLEGAVTTPEQRLSRLPLLGESERHILRQWNQSARPFPAGQCLHQLFEALARTEPDATAAILGEQQLSYAQLNARANQWAHHLIASGVGPDVLVGVCLERSLDLVTVLMAVLKAGGAYLPLDPNYPSERLQFMVEDSGIHHLISHSGLLERLPKSVSNVICVDHTSESIAAHPNSNPFSPVTPDNLAYVIYTSGSTGRPKGVLVEHHGWCNLAHAQRETFGLRPGMRVLQFASLSFDASAFELSMALANGGTLVLAERETLIPGVGLTRLLHDAAINVVTLPPSALAVLNAGALPALEVITVAGEACPVTLVERWAAPRRRFFNLYGPTEATIWSSFAECRPGAGAPPIGRPVANVRLYVLDASAQPLPLGMPGELYIGGAGVTRGYLNRPALNNERFIPDPFSDTPGARLYRSGDLVRLRTDGELEFLGRLDHQVKLRGFRIELGEIEEVLREHPGVGAAIVIARGQAGDQTLAAYVSPAPGQTADGATLRQYLGARLPSHMTPAAVVVLPQLPLTANGKVDRAALPAPGEQTATSGATAQTALEQTIATIWGEVLNLQQIDRQRSFFDLGGHSLKLAQVQALLASRLGRDIDLVELFKYPTISSLAAFLEEGAKTAVTETRRSSTQVATDRARLAGLAQRQLAARQRMNREQDKDTPTDE